jgi:16S rRNA G966 N2-methylase RsmD
MDCLGCNKPFVEADTGRKRKFCTDTCKKAFSRRVNAFKFVGIPLQPQAYCARFEAWQPVLHNKVDVIITDPPYGRDALPLYKDLATFAQTVLVPGGWMFCLTGWGLDWDIRQIFTRAGLEFVTVCTYLMAGATLTGKKHTSTGYRVFQQQAKPLLWYQKRGTKLDRRRAGTSDLVREVVSSQKKKGPVIVGTTDLDRTDFHWQQSLSAFKQIVWFYTNPQDVICDPCMGSGTTVIAAIAQGRQRVIGIEKDLETWTQASKRIGLQSEEPSHA